MIKSSVIIPVMLLPDKDYELYNFTKNAIDSFRQHCKDFELIIVDNASTCGIEYLQSEADIYIKNKVNLGYGKAVNQGLKLANGQFLIAANNDIILYDDWISQAIEHWNDDIGAISSHLLDHDKERLVGFEDCTKRLNMMGALWMISKTVYDTIGGLDEDFEIGYFEDSMYWQELKYYNYKLGKVGHITHIGNATSGKINGLSEIVERNKKLYYQKIVELKRED